MARLGKRLLYFLWFYGDLCLVLRGLAALLDGWLPAQQADWRSAAVFVGAMALTAAAVYPVFRRMGQKPVWRLAAGLMAGAGYWYLAAAAAGQLPHAAAFSAAPAAVMAYITVCGLKKPELYW